MKVEIYIQSSDDTLWLIDADNSSEGTPLLASAYSEEAYPRLVKDFAHHCFIWIPLTGDDAEELATLEPVAVYEV